MNVSLARRNDFATVGQAQERPVTAGPELTVVIPTLNERDNIEPLVDLLDAVLDTVSWEVIFVDDDLPDGTSERIREISRRDRRVRCLQRIGRRGLTTACIEGALATSAPYIAIMDADMQHDEKLLPQMLAILKSEPLDLVVGSRHVVGGGIGGLSAARAKISAFAGRLSRIICKSEIADPMSGFFMLRREVLESGSPAPFRPRLQDSPRYPRVVAAAAAIQGAALRVPRATARREQTRYARRLGIHDADRR